MTIVTPPRCRGSRGRPETGLSVAKGEQVQQVKTPKRTAKKKSGKTKSAAIEKEIHDSPRSDLWESISRMAGRNDLPELLWDAFKRRRFSKDIDGLAVAITDAWTSADWPLIRLDMIQWFKMFERTGYIVDGLRVSERPAKPFRVYRAAIIGREKGFSWSEDIGVARFFKGYTASRLRIEDRHGKIVPHEIYTAIVQPQDLLARFTGKRGGRDENEWVLVGDRLESIERIDD
jgi:hypothetical protein